MVSVNLESIPSQGKHRKKQILLVYILNLMDSLSWEIFCEADCSSQKIKLTSLGFFFLFRGVYTVPRKASWQTVLTFKAFYPSLSLAGSTVNQVFFTMSLRSRYIFTPPAETGEIWATSSPETIPSHIAWCCVPVPGKGRVKTSLKDTDILQGKLHPCPGQMRPGGSEAGDHQDSPTLGFSRCLVGRGFMRMHSCHLDCAYLSLWHWPLEFHQRSFQTQLP